MGFGREGFERAASLERENAGDVGATLRRLIGYLMPHKRDLTLSMVSMVLSAVALAVSPFIVAYTIDNYILAGNVSGLMRMLGFLLIAFAFQYIGFRGQFYYVGMMGQEVMARIRSEVFAKIQQLSLSYFDKHDAGDLMSRLVNDVDVLNQFLSQGFVQFIGGIVRMVFVAVAMFLVDWRLALATLIVVPMMIMVSTYLSRLARKAFRESRESLGDVSTELEEGISGVKVAQAFNRSEENVRHFEELNRRNRDANVGAVGVSSAFMPAMEVLNALATTIVAGYGGYQAITGAVSVGVVVGFLEYVRRFFFPVQQIAQLWVLVQSSLAGAERIFHLLDEDETLTDTPNAQPIPQIQGRIVFDNVHFEYDEGEPILRGLSLSAEPGQTIAVVGPTGAGKTTLINLLSRFYDVSDGRVLIDGIDVRDVTQDSLRSQIGVVLQDNFLFTGTVADNIRYGRLDASDEEVEIAARTVGAHGFISNLPQGYQTELGERGGNLSQGQRQLISFGRAILANPRVLVLDEATASVDTRTELVIQEALKKLLAGRTSFVIAHRLSTIRDADQVLVMEQGQVVERGTHDELVARGGAYAQLHARQFRDVSGVAVNGSGVNGKVRSRGAEE